MSDINTKEDQKNAENSNPLKCLVICLRSGRQITNGHQSISFSPEANRGYMVCDTPGCCDYDFEGIDEIVDFINNNYQDWCCA